MTSDFDKKIIDLHLKYTELQIKLDNLECLIIQLKKENKELKAYINALLALSDKG